MVQYRLDYKRQKYENKLNGMLQGIPYRELLERTEKILLLWENDRKIYRHFGKVIEKFKSTGKNLKNTSILEK